MKDIQLSGIVGVAAVPAELRFIGGSICVEIPEEHESRCPRKPRPGLGARFSVGMSLFHPAFSRISQHEQRPRRLATVRTRRPQQTNSEGGLFEFCEESIARPPGARPSRRAGRRKHSVRSGMRALRWRAGGGVFFGRCVCPTNTKQSHSTARISQ